MAILSMHKLIVINSNNLVQAVHTLLQCNCDVKCLLDVELKLINQGRAPNKSMERTYPSFYIICSGLI